MMKFTLFIMGLMALPAYGSQKVRHHLHLDDVIWSLDQAQESLHTMTRPSDCRAHIKEVICLADTPEDKEQAKCREGGEAYASHFEALYDAYPPALQKMFCSLRSIAILKEFYGTAYAGLLHDENGNVTGAEIGIRQSVLDEKLSLQTWASWKEQLSFGGIKDSFTLTEDLPHAETPRNPKVNDFLYFVIAHEFGHIFDFANELNRCDTKPSAAEAPECDLATGSWGALSWQTTRKPLQENEFANREGLCFYACENGTLAKDVISALYADLFERTSFLSTYAATDPWQDFADSLAYYLMHRYLGTSYTLNTMQGQRYDVMAKLTSGAYAKHYQYIEEFLSRSDIVYP